jgi:hypothetical protein
MTFLTIARVAGFFGVLAIIVLSLVPGTYRPHTGLPGVAEHFIAYCSTAFAFALGPPPFSAMSDVVNDSFIPKLYPQQQDSECRMVDRLLLQLVTSPIFLIVSPFSLFAIIVKRARDQQQKKAWMERERLKRRI